MSETQQEEREALFTWDDVDTLREVAEYLHSSVSVGVPGRMMSETGASLASLAGRMARRLPPRQPYE